MLMILFCTVTTPLQPSYYISYAWSGDFVEMLHSTVDRCVHACVYVWTCVLYVHVWV